MDEQPTQPRPLHPWTLFVIVTAVFISIGLVGVALGILLMNAGPADDTRDAEVTVVAPSENSNRAEDDKSSHDLSPYTDCVGNCP